MKKCVIALSLSFMFGSVAAEGPKPDSQRIDAAITQIERQASFSGQKLNSEQKKELRGNLEKQMRQTDILKAEAIKQGLDKDPVIQNLLKNVEAEFYATQYIEYLYQHAEVDDKDMHKDYKQLVRDVKIQQAAFPEEADAKAALTKLSKGMSFRDLIKTLPKNQAADSEDFVAIHSLPPELLGLVAGMKKGEMTKEPVKINNIYYLIKVSDERPSAKAPSFEAFKAQMIQEKKKQIVDQKIIQLFREQGVLQ